MAKDLIIPSRVPVQRRKLIDEDWIDNCNDIRLLKSQLKIASQHVEELHSVDQHNRNVVFKLRNALEQLKDPQIVIEYLQRLGYTVTPPMLESKRDYSKKRDHKR